MRLLAGLLCLVPHIWTVNANVEKTIFLGPEILALPHDILGSEHLRLHVLNHSQTILPTQLPVQFPSKQAPRGLEYWYLLQPLEAGRRYEVRICWPATQPTDFWLDTFSLTHVNETPELLASLSSYCSQTRANEEIPLRTAISVKESVLLLRVQAAAAYHSANRTLMESPLPVDADIILDPFILNVLPRSLFPIGLYLIVVTIGGWILSGRIYLYIQSLAAEPLRKPHTD